MKFSRTRTISFVATLLAGVISGCGAQDEEFESPVAKSEEAIIKGTTVTTETEGVVEVNGGCSGTLMTNQWVITAKHCVNAATANANSINYESTIGTKKNYVADSVTTHPSKDVALLHLADRVTAFGGAYTINNVLALPNPSSLVGKTVTCYGYGVYDNKGTSDGSKWTGYGTLRKASLTVSSASDDAVVVDKNASGQTGFHGDSGGPCFYVTNGWRYQIGIVSGGGPGTTDANPINTSLVTASAIRDWAEWTMFTGDEDLGGALWYPPAITSPKVNDVEIVGMGGDSAMWLKRWNGSSWMDWSSLGGAFTSGPAIASPSSTKMMVFGRGTDNAIWVNTSTSGSWSGWSSLGGTATSSPAAVSSKDGNTWVFVRGTENALWYRKFNGSSWTDWTSLGGTHLSDPSATSMATGDVHVYSLDANRRIQGNYSTNGTWNSWGIIDNTTFSAAPVVTSSSNNRIDLFIRNADGSISYRKWYGMWQPTWNNLGYAAVSDPDATSWGTGRIDVAFVGTGNSMRHFSFGSY